MTKQSTSQGQFLTAILLVALLASSWRMFSLDGQKRNVDQAHEQAKEELNRLQADYGVLLEEQDLLEDELLGVRDNSFTARERVRALRQELTRLQERLEGTTIELATLKRERDVLYEDNLSLSEQFQRVFLEKQQLEAKFSSIRELKLAMRDVKQKVRERRWASWRARAEALKAKDARLLAEGNRGYALRDGQSMLGTATRLHVRVLEPHSP